MLFFRDGVFVGSFQYEGNNEQHYFVKNAEGQEYEVDEELYCFLMQNDWDGPLEFPIELQSEIPRLIDEKIIQTSRFFPVKGVINRLIVSCVRCESEKMKSAYKTVNRFLPAGSATLFLFGLLSVLFHGRQYYDCFNLWLFYLLFGVSIALHEVGHMIASLASGATHGQLGVLFFCVFPIGAYYGQRSDVKMKQEEKVQFSLAGVEMNLLVAGICLLCSSYYPSVSGTMALTARANIAMLLVNLLPTNGLDGEAALSAMLGTDDIYRFAKKWIRDPKRRSRLLHSGWFGIIWFAVFLITISARLIFCGVVITEVCSLIFLLINFVGMIV